MNLSSGITSCGMALGVIKRRPIEAMAQGIVHAADIFMGGPPASSGRDENTISAAMQLFLRTGSLLFVCPKKCVKGDKGRMPRT
jgi:hypothetical protein